MGLIGSTCTALPRGVRAAQVLVRGVQELTVPQGPFHTGPELFDAWSELFDSGPERFDARAELFNTGAELFDSGPELFDGGPELFDTGAELFDTGPELFDTGPELFNTGPELFDTWPTLLDTGPELFDTWPTLLHTGPELFDTWPTLLHSGPELLHTWPTLLHSGPELFDNWPTLLHTGPELSDTWPALLEPAKFYLIPGQDCYLLSGAVAANRTHSNVACDPEVPVYVSSTHCVWPGAHERCTASLASGVPTFQFFTLFTQGLVVCLAAVKAARIFGLLGDNDDAVPRGGEQSAEAGEQRVQLNPLPRDGQAYIARHVTDAHTRLFSLS